MEKQEILSIEERERIQKWLKVKIDEYTDNGEYNITERLEKIDDSILQNALDNVRYDCLESFRNCLYEALSEEYDGFIFGEDDLFDSIEMDALNDDMNELLESLFDEYDGRQVEAYQDQGYQGTVINIEELLNKNYNVNLVLATKKELNLDCGAITDFFKGYDTKENFVSDMDNYCDNALTYIIHQQGHTLEEVFAHISGKQPSDNEFVKSVAEEIENYTYSIAQLTVLASADKENIIDLLDNVKYKKGNVELSENCSVGFTNDDRGASSYFEIKLEKPLVIPSEIIWKAEIGNAGKSMKYRYSVSSIIGDGYERGTAAGTNHEPTLVQETTETLENAFEAKTYDNGKEYV